MRLSALQAAGVRQNSGPKMRWFVYEDSSAEKLAPIALMRPVFELLCGREGLRRRLQRWFPAKSWGAFVRPWLAPVYAEEHPEAAVNDLQARGVEQHTGASGHQCFALFDDRLIARWWEWRMGVSRTMSV